MRRWRRNSRGQSLVEFALVLPIFLLIFFGLIDVGRVVYLQNAFNEAAREAARYGSVEQWVYGCPSSVPLAQQDRFRCTQQVALERIAGAPAYVDTNPNLVKCSSNGDPGGSGNVAATDCRAGYLLKVTVQTPSTPAAQQFHFFTPIIGNLIGPVTIAGQAQVVVQ